MGFPIGSGHALGPLVSCLFTPGGAGSCWGNNTNGELSASAYTESYAPVSMTATASVAQVAIGDAHMCVLTGKTVRCWGDDEHGQLGDGKTPAAGPHPTAVDVVF